MTIALFLLPAIMTAQDLRIAAASDLAGVQKQFAQAFAMQGKLQFSLGSSGILAKQIENGAPFDVFLSANERYIDELARAGHVEGFSARVYATGQLGLWSPSGNIRTLTDLLRADVKHIAMANPLHAPYGVAAREAIEKQPDLWIKLQPKIVYGENVRQALQFAESGNADAVITAWSLLLNKPAAVKISATEHQPIRQAAAIVKSSKHKDLATRFIDWLTQDAGQQILRNSGFNPPQSLP